MANNDKAAYRRPSAGGSSFVMTGSHRYAPPPPIFSDKRDKACLVFTKKSYHNNKRFIMKANRFLLAAGILLAMAFTFSCSSGGGGSQSPSLGTIGCVLGSGCVTMDLDACLQRGGDPFDSCPSEGDGSSSSRIGNSSSSVTVGGKGSSSSGNGGNSSSSSVGGGSSPSGGKGNDIANYNTKKIGEQTWMAENLDYAVEGSKCYNNDPANCVKYGRLYDWATAIGVCPSGWHLPSNAEWDQLLLTTDDYLSPGVHLKAKDGWNSCGPSGSGSDYLCEDTYGFAALPGGHFDENAFGNIGSTGYWWTSDEISSGGNYYYYYGMSYPSDGVIRISANKSRMFSVRCVQD
jgi:uncharacterized protein (TIGR02145 family)